MCMRVYIYVYVCICLYMYIYIHMYMYCASKHFVNFFITIECILCNIVNVYFVFCKPLQIINNLNR